MARGRKFTHRLENTETGEVENLGDFVDSNNAHPRGSLGFLTVQGERFAVDDLFIYPPGTKKP